MSSSVPNILRKLNYVLWKASQLVGAIALFKLSWQLRANLRFLQWASHHQQPPSSLPLVSILVPARNEITSIGTCILSLVQQAYPRFEIIALDDQSTDGTGERLDELAQSYEYLHVIHSTETPPLGWNGKSYACCRLAEQAHGEWLLFTDADTVHTPYSLQLGMAQAEVLQADLLTAFPYQETRSWTERVMVSFIIDFLPLVGTHFKAIWCGTAARVVANGQYMLVRRESYDAVGGHLFVVRERVDDFALARLLYMRGYTVAPVNGANMLRCRMYHNAKEVWRGFSKNLMLGLTTSGPNAKRQTPLFVFAYASVFVLPFVSLFQLGQRKVGLLFIAWLTGLRAIATIFLRRPQTESLTTFPAAWGVMALGLNALTSQRRGRSTLWKGRRYQD
jgi:chlorobactene glucosyltransferase